MERFNPRTVPWFRAVRSACGILAADLAAIDGVPTKRSNEQVRRNSTRFPRDFVLPLASPPP
ncbi:MAG: ORF6N domain-containing protein [Planctomycetota bacterium]